MKCGNGHVPITFTGFTLNSLTLGLSNAPKISSVEVSSVLMLLIFQLCYPKEERYSYKIINLIFMIQLYEWLVVICIFICVFFLL